MGAGRKPKPLEVKQGHAVTANLTQAEHDELVRRAGGEPLASYLRRLVLRHLARRSK